HFSIAHVFGLTAFLKIRSLKFGGCFSHRISFVLTYESHPTDPVTVLEASFRERFQRGAAKIAASLFDFWTTRRFGNIRKPEDKKLELKLPWQIVVRFAILRIEN